MAVKTTLEQLEEVQAAITTVMSAQQYSVEDSIDVRKATLDSLTKREDKLLARYNRESGSARTGVLTRPNWAGVSVEDL